MAKEPTLKTRRYSSVVIDGIHYVPATSKPLKAEEKRLLAEVYGKLWTEAYYDPWNEDTKKFAQPLADMMTKLNDMLRFKS
jgi:hypothetical protein